MPLSRLRPPLLRRRDRRDGFTLIELLAVIGIASLLAGMALVAIMGARKAAKRSAITFQLQTIQTALNAYHDEFEGYPPVYIGAPPFAVADSNPMPDNGAFALCRAMFGLAPANWPSGVTDPAVPYDGNDGPGFRNKRDTATGAPLGKVFGPYLDPDKFRFGYAIDDGGTAVTTEPGTVFQPIDYGRLMILDVNGKPFLYGPTMTSKPKFTLPNGSVNPKVFYAVQQSMGSHATDTVYFNINTLLGNPTNPKYGAAEFLNYRKLLYLPTEANETNFVRRVQIMLGDNSSPTPDGQLGPGETLPFDRGAYILWSAGVDGQFGAPDGKASDDVVITE